ncbi:MULTISPECIES: DUF1302 domain-containing protein [Paraburkholderia]|uniref:DUF1302 domain-containing protein n=1 Tax=Paraburkholderia TaxID=1822464 RepID=UPI00224EFEFD|nr:MULTISPECIES: DUF1302 family protein [Paraburkholderia]MCX4176982.1 DUF1302 family protein [Paraburkholderia madseniana]MDQ6464972.1 DUF1302 domain-containing protein [Paraburkholderia madseniana]
MKTTLGKVGVCLGMATLSVGASAYEFDTGLGDLHGSWVSNVTGGLGLRLKNPSCSLTGDPNAYNHCGDGANVDQYGAGSNGNLNYKKGQLYTTYLSLTSELLLTMPQEGYKFMVRGTGLYDFLASDTSYTPLSSTAKAQAVYNVTLLDLWGEKDFDIAGHPAHVRLGNQVINWGESYFASGGINATNALDIQKLLIPGTQLKQALLPAPMLSFASELPYGFSTEAYYQFQWSSNRYPPVGTYFSTTNVFGRGMLPYTVNSNNFNVAGIGQGAVSVPVSTNLPRDSSPQYGVKLTYKPKAIDANFGLYYEEYTDKSPVLSSLSNGSLQWSYLGRRKLVGASTNFQLGDWAIGSELSYRPKDAIALTGCYGAGGALDANTNGVSGIDCQQWIDKKKIQFDINGQINLTQSTAPFIKLLGAEAAVFTAEFTWVKYPGVSADSLYYRTINGVNVVQAPAAGYSNWLNNTSGLGYPIATGQGTSNSGGITLDFNWTYDGSLIRGWQVTPGVTFSDSILGYTPTFSANYMAGAKSINVYVLFNQNPAVWQGGVNFTTYFGGNALSQPYADRNFVGAFVTRNF